MAQRIFALTDGVRFDLNTFGTIHDLSDITQIQIGVDGPFPLCVANIELSIADCGDGTGCGFPRVGFHKDFVADTGACAQAINSFRGGPSVIVDFNELRLMA